MDWKALLDSMNIADSRYPARTAKIRALQKVLNGEQYDHLLYAFHQERKDGGAYIPLKDRRPSTRSNLCRIVVDDVVALLFGDKHMPTVQAEDEQDRQAFADLMVEHHFGCLMMEAATQGSVGSVAILMRVLKNKPHYEVLTTEYLTPVYDPTDPCNLAQVREKYIATPAQLRDAGYAVADDAGNHWFQRDWTVSHEVWYQPWPVANADDFKPVIDEKRTVHHGLGFVPMLWVKNLPGGKGVDGASTFELAIDTVIEMDYLMSQGTRALRYSSDPLLVLKGPQDPDAGQEGGSANALVLSPEGDAKMLEITGGASASLINHVRELRYEAIEIMHGNRSHPDKMQASQSGRAMELMNQDLVWLAGKLRTSYGNGALVSLLKMTTAASRRVRGGLIINGKKVKLKGDDLWLKWPDWYSPTADERFAEMNAFQVGLENGVISRETAVSTAMSIYDIPDLSAELAKIKTDMSEEDQRQITLAQAQAKAQAAARPQPTAQPKA